MRYAELHARSYFSFHEGASKPSELVARAKAVGVEALAVTDENGVYGVVEARDALLELHGLVRGADEPKSSPRLIFGSELHVEGDVVVALARTKEGWANLCRLVTRGRLAAPKGEFLLTTDELCAHAKGLVLLAGGPRSRAMAELCEGERPAAEKRLAILREAFGEDLHVELVRHLNPPDHARSREMAALARRLSLAIVATNDVSFHAREWRRLHDVLRCIKLGVTLREAGRRLLGNGEAHLKSPAQMAALFADLPEAVERTVQIAESISFRLCDVKYEPPAPDLPPGVGADEQLDRLARQGLRARLADWPRYTGQLEHELAVIRELGYAGFFLTMRDIVEACHARGILCQGRGSAANSLVCFALDITSVRPDVIPMLFERFLSKERDEPPDIDLDIEHERREEILQYVYAKYGRDHAGMVSEVIRYRARLAANEVGKVLGFSAEQLKRLSKFLSHGAGEVDGRVLAGAGVDPHNPMISLLFRCAAALEGYPRHLSIHVGGFILSKPPLFDSVPLENARMAERTIVQWNKDDVDSMGMFKLDLLALGMLTLIAKAFALLRARGVELTLQTVPAEDAATYEMLSRADTVGVFQVESRAQMSMLPRLRPKTFYDLVIEVALVRPGPIQGQMVHPYLKRREGREPVEYPHPSLEAVLGRTLGVPLFQEQVMRFAEVVGGYTPGEADQLRRDMGSFRATGRMERHRARLRAAMLERGISEAYAERLVRQLEGFGAYGFPESHAAAFAQLAYVSTWLKRHHPVEFTAALLNAQPMGFYSPAVIVNDAKRHEVEVRPVDVQHSRWDATVEGEALRLGLRLVRGLREQTGRAIETAREAGAFASVEELRARAGASTRELTALAAAGALRSLKPRREALWAAARHDDGPLFRGIAARDPDATLPPLSTLEELRLDVTFGGAFPGRHPMELVRPRLPKNVLTAREIKDAEIDRTVHAAGLVITRQRPGKGLVVFVTLEDETGHTDVAVPLSTFKKFEQVIRLSPALIVRGRLAGTGAARNINASHFRALAVDELATARAHDFH